MPPSATARIAPRAPGPIERPASVEPPVEQLVEQPVEKVPGDPRRGLLILCDHASNHVPDDLDRLGVPEHEFARHIAYDIGAAAVTRGLAGLLGVPAVLTTFSRLIIDPNRGRGDPTLVMRLSDGAVVPGNARIDAAGVARRIRRFYDPYDRAIDAAVAAGEAAGAPPAIVTVHSFTRYWRGRERPWQVGVLYDCGEVGEGAGDEAGDEAGDGVGEGAHLSRRLIAALRADPAGLTVGDNAPYAGGLPGDTIDRHAIRRGLPNALIEIRQDLLLDRGGIEEWAQRFAGLMQPLLKRGVDAALSA